MIKHGQSKDIDPVSLTKARIAISAVACAPENRIHQKQHDDDDVTAEQYARITGP